MVQSNDTCLLSSLEEDLNVNDMAKELLMGNNVQGWFEEVYTIKIKKLLLRNEDRQDLEEDMKDLCKTSVLIKTEDKGLTEAEYEALLEKDENGDGNVVIIGESSNSSGSNDSCWVQVIIISQYQIY